MVDLPVFYQQLLFLVPASNTLIISDRPLVCFGKKWIMQYNPETIQKASLFNIANKFLSMIFSIISEPI